MANEKEFYTDCNDELLMENEPDGEPSHNERMLYVFGAAYD